MQRYTGEKEPGILEEERRDGRQDCGRGGGAGGAGRGHSYFILNGMRRSKMAQALSVLFTPVFPDLEQCLLAHGRTSINICCLIENKSTKETKPILLDQRKQTFSLQP